MNVVNTNAIKAELVKRGLNYSNLAKKLDISISTLGNKMNHRSTFSIDELVIIANFFNKEVSFFLK